MSRADDLIEANKRGLLTGQIKSDFDQAVASGLIVLPAAQPTQQPQPEQPEQYQANLNQPSALGELVSGITDPLGQMVGSIAGKAAGGIETLVRAPFQGLDQAIKEGQKTEQSIADFSSPISDTGKVTTDAVISTLSQAGKIPAGWAGIAKLATGGGVESSVNTIRNIEEKGLPKVAGEFAMDKTGSPLIATMVEASPEIAALFFAKKSFGNKAKTIKAERDLQLIEDINSGKESKTLAQFKISQRDSWDKVDPIEVKVLSEKLNIDKEFAKKLAQTIPKIEKKTTFKPAVKQGWDEGYLGMVEASSKSDINVFKNMLDIYEDGINKPRTKATKRPIFESGKAIDNQVKFLLKKKNEAGKRVGESAKEFRGVKLEHEPIIDNFISKLEADGVVFNKGEPITNVKQMGDIDFRNSPYDGSKASENLLRNTIRRMTEKDFEIDGFNLHTLKQNLPSKISTAKRSDGGLVEKAENALGDLRRDVNELLRSNSDSYKKANNDFIEAIEPLNKLNDTMPANNKIDWEGVNPDKSGLQVRKVLSNYNNGIDVAEAITNLNKTALKLGGKFTDDAISQALFSIQLDKRLGAFAETSLEGVTSSGTANVLGRIPLSSTDAAKQGLGALMRKFKKQDSETAIKAMRDYLNESSKGKQ